MHKVLQDGARVLLSLSERELVFISRLLTEACASSQTTNLKVPEKYGISQEELHQALRALSAEVDDSRQTCELVQAWEDQGAVMVRVMNTWGDPVGMGEVMAREFAECLQRAINEAS